MKQGRATLLRESVISALHTLLGIYIRHKTIAPNSNRERLIRSLAEAPVTSSKRACIINTKEETFSIRDEDQKASETITCQRVALGVGVGRRGGTHTGSLRRHASDQTKMITARRGAESWRGVETFSFLPAISPRRAASPNYLCCSFKSKCHFHVVSTAAPVISKRNGDKAPPQL